MKKLFLHIGLNKTGSTYIQRSLVENRKTLAASGYDYPADPAAPYVQNMHHVPLASAMTGVALRAVNAANTRTLGHAIDSFLDDVRRSPCHSVILSSEAFADISIPEDRLQNIANTLSEFDVSIVVYVRPQDGYILSAYQEDLKIGRSERFDLETKLNGHQADYVRRIRRWQNVFGSDKTIIRTMKPLQSGHSNLFLDFLDAISAPTDNVTCPPLINEGMDYRDLKLLQEFNAYCQQKISKAGDYRVAEMRAILIKALNAQDGLSEPREKLSLSEAQIADISAHFQSDNIALLGQEIGGDWIAGKDPDAAPGNIDVEQLDPTATGRLIVRLCHIIQTLQK